MTEPIAQEPAAAFFILPFLGFVLVAGISLAVIALIIWVAYRLVVSAVRAGTLAAHADLARQEQGLPPRPVEHVRGPTARGPQLTP